MDLIELIYNREISLLKSANRSSDEFINSILTEDFIEFGSSGNTHTRDDVIHWLSHESSFDFEVINFQAELLAENVVLAKYQIRMNGSNSKRSSVWILDNEHWKMKFHQGTKVTG